MNLQIKKSDDIILLGSLILGYIIPGMVILDIFFNKGFFSENITNYPELILLFLYSLLFSIPFVVVGGEVLGNCQIEPLTTKRFKNISQEEEYIAISVFSFISFLIIFGLYYLLSLFEIQQNNILTLSLIWFAFFMVAIFNGSLLRKNKIAEYAIKRIVDFIFYLLIRGAPLVLGALIGSNLVNFYRTHHEYYLQQGLLYVIFIISYGLILERIFNRKK